MTSLQVASGPGSVCRLPASGDEAHADQRGEGDGEPVRPGGLDADGGEHDAEHDAHDAVGAHDDRVVAEAARARADAAGEVGRRVGDERDDERGHHHPVAVEVVRRDQRAERRGWRG